MSEYKPVADKALTDILEYTNPEIYCETKALKAMAQEILQRREADRKWQSAGTHVWGAHKVNDHYTVYPNNIFMLTAEDMYMPYYESEEYPEPPEVSQ